MMSTKRAKTMAQKKKVSEEDRTMNTDIVLVGTYKEKQLAWIKRNGVYNYPVKEGDELTDEVCQQIKELWLYADVKSTRHLFSAEFVQKMTYDEFVAIYPTYSKLGKSKNSAYYVFKTETLDYGSLLEGRVVIARTSDFGRRTVQVRKALEQFKADCNFEKLSKYLPSDLGRIPHNHLRVCESAVQLDFLSLIFPKAGPGYEYGKASVEEICHSVGCTHGTPGWPDDFGKGLRKFFDRNPSCRVRTLSLFSGAGGLDIGFSDAGFDIVDSVEIEKKFCATLELNSGSGKRFCHSKVNCIDIRKFSGRELGNIDFIIGGPPCQTFSAAGRRANGVLGTTDARGVLFREYVRLLQELKPRGFLFENVYGLTGAQRGEAWREIQESFAEAGYTIFSRILDAADFGVPQHRERLIIVGLKSGNYKFPRPTHGPDSATNTPFYSAGTAIRGLELTDEEKKPGLGGRFGYLLDEIPPGLNYSYYTKEMGHPKPVFAWRSKFSDFLYKADPATPVRTIKAQGGAYTGPLHWDNRFFACAEYKRLQTFPDDYKISGGKQVAVKQIGNSVPPQLARMLAISIQAQLFGVTFPFKLDYLNPEDKLTFRSRKIGVMDSYRRKARECILRLPKTKLECKPFDCEYYCRISDRFKFDKCEPCEGSYRAIVKWGEELRIDFFDFGQSSQEEISFVIEINPSKLTWDLPFTKVVLKSHSRQMISFTIAWKAFEEIVASKGVKADLVQLNGYYQYSPELICKCNFLAPFEYSNIIAKIVAGENVRRLVPEIELAQSWGIPKEKVIDVAVALRSIGYEIRNNKTNPQIAPGQWLIPYVFPTLNHMSVQLGKEIK